MLDFSTVPMRLSAILIGLMMATVIALSSASGFGKTIEDTPVKDLAANEVTAQRPATVIRVSLPITLASGQQIQQSLQKFLLQAPDAARAEDRAVAVLEFETSLQRTGSGSDFDACMSAARSSRLKVLTFTVRRYLGISAHTFRSDISSIRSASRYHQRTLWPPDHRHGSLLCLT